MKNFLENHWLKLLAVLMLLGVMTNYFPFFYYQLMNWVVVGAALTAAWQFKKLSYQWLSWFFVLVAVVFNPIQPLLLQQNVWRILDIIAAALFLLVVIFLKPKK
ncbi:MAG TPA: DUF6804 family protein [Patescibacteria group bacterium]|jgi:arginine exporter protein ArgO|nr:DUF6804 family protein [Patescibacteria group bacterium]